MHSQSLSFFNNSEMVRSVNSFIMENRYPYILHGQYLDQRSPDDAWSCWIKSHHGISRSQHQTGYNVPDSKVHGAHLRPTGPRWAPYWPHEPCYLWYVMTPIQLNFKEISEQYVNLNLL